MGEYIVAGGTRKRMTNLYRIIFVFFSLGCVSIIFFFTYTLFWLNMLNIMIQRDIEK